MPSALTARVDSATTQCRCRFRSRSGGASEMALIVRPRTIFLFPNKHERFPMKKSIVLATLLAFSSASYALVDCAGRVTSLSLTTTSGTVVVSLLGGPTYIYMCSVEATDNGVSATTPKQMYQTLQLAKVTGATMTFRFDGYTSCSAIPSWTAVPLNGWNLVLD